MFGIPVSVILGQLMLGLVNGSFYAMLSLGLAVIFGLLNIINFTHGALYMVGAFCAWFLLQYAGVGYWWAEKPFFDEAARWNAAAHWVSLAWLRSITVPVITVKSLRQSLLAQRYTPAFLVA